MGKVASSPVVAIVGAGATLANAGAFIPLALKAISEQNPSAAQYIAYWVGFTVVSLLPLGVAILMLLVARDWTVRILNAARGWLLLHAAGCRRSDSGITRGGSLAKRNHRADIEVWVTSSTRTDETRS